MNVSLPMSAAARRRIVILRNAILNQMSALLARIVAFYTLWWHNIYSFRCFAVGHKRVLQTIKRKLIFRITPINLSNDKITGKKMEIVHQLFQLNLFFHGDQSWLYFPDLVVIDDCFNWSRHFKQNNWSIIPVEFQQG